MKFLHALWSFGTDADTGDPGSAPTQSQTAIDGVPSGTDAGPPATDADALATDGVAAGTGTVARGIGERPVLAGHLVWNPRTRACEWELPEGVAPLTPQDDAEPWFPWDVDEHAHEFYEALIDWGCCGRAIVYLELAELYKVMCHRLGREPGPWIKVGAALRRITKGRKTSPWSSGTTASPVVFVCTTSRSSCRQEGVVVAYQAPALAEARAA